MKKRLIWFLRGTRSSDRQSGGWCSHFSGCQSDKSQVVRRSKLQRTAIRVSKCFCGLGLFMLDGPNAAAGGLTVLSGRKPGLKRGSSLLIKLWAPTAVKTSAPSGLCRARILSVGLDVKMFSSSDSNIFPPFSFSFSFPLQGGSSRVPQEKERVRQMSGKPRGCVGKPKQDPDWRAESTEGHLLPQSWVAAAVLWSRAGDGAVYRLLQQNVKKTKQNKTEKTLEQKLLRPSLFLCSLRPGLLWSVPGIFEQLELASFSLSFLSCGLCMWRLKCRTHYALLLLFVHRGAGRGLGGGKASQWEPAWRRGNRKRKYRCFLKMCRSSARDYDEKPPPRQVSRGLANQQSFSEVRRGATRSSRRSTTSCNQATQPCLPDSVIAPCTPPRFFSFSVVSCIPSCENTIKGEITNHHQGFVSEVISWNSSTLFFFLVFFFSSYRSSWFGHKRFFRENDEWTRRVQDERPLKVYAQNFENVF